MDSTVENTWWLILFQSLQETDQKTRPPSRHSVSFFTRVAEHPSKTTQQTSRPLHRWTVHRTTSRRPRCIEPRCPEYPNTSVQWVRTGAGRSSGPRVHGTGALLSSPPLTIPMLGKQSELASCVFSSWNAANGSQGVLC